MYFNNTELIVMLTYNDRTLQNAYTIFEECKDSKAKFWGMKEEGLPPEQMKVLYAYMKECGKSTVLEVVAYTEEKCIEGAEMAVDCGCDILMGTIFYDYVNDFCKKNNIKYMPFVGKVHGRPSILDGSIEKMIDEANEYLEKGVYGFDLLGYRYTGNSSILNDAFLSRVKAPVCFAGNINSYSRLLEVKNSAPWAFTIGGAFFENKFGDTYAEQIDRVCDFMGMDMERFENINSK